METEWDDYVEDQFLGVRFRMTQMTGDPVDKMAVRYKKSRHKRMF